MATITIEGSLTPAAGLARGERREVQDTEAVRDYVARGFAVVVDEKTGEAEPPELPEPAKAPAKSASRDDWAEWLAENTDVVTEGRTRDQLVGDYEVWLESHDQPADEG